MVREAPLLDYLLGGYVAYCEEDGGCDGLGEERAGRETGLVPAEHCDGGDDVLWGWIETICTW